MTMNEGAVTNSETFTRETGRVKWFNNKSGYGFITRKTNDDVFVHHSAVTVELEQYKYLVQGEYVEFSVVETTNGPHKYQASNVVGVNGGKLMCETKREFKIARSNYKNVRTTETKEEPVVKQQNVEEKPVEEKLVKQKRVVRNKQKTVEDSPEWTIVKKEQKTTKKPRKAI